MYIQCTFFALNYDGELDDLLTRTIGRIVGKPSPEFTEMAREVIDRQLGKHYPWSGNLKELKQCVRRVLLMRGYAGNHHEAAPDDRSHLMEWVDRGTVDGQSVLAGYCYLLSAIRNV